MNVADNILISVRGHKEAGFKGFVYVREGQYYVDSGITRLTWDDAMKDAENLKAELLEENGIRQEGK